MTRRILVSYGMQEVGRIKLASPTQFVIEPTNPAAWEWERSIYAFLIGEEICRIGSSKERLKKRMASWQRDVSARLGAMDYPGKMATKADEAAQWKDRLERHGQGAVFARRGTMVTTPVGEISAYLDEESVLIGRHLPLLNGSKHR